MRQCANTSTYSARRAHDATLVRGTCAAQATVAKVERDGKMRMRDSVKRSTKNNEKDRVGSARLQATPARNPQRQAALQWQG